MTDFYVFRRIESQAWWRALDALAGALEATGPGSEKGGAPLRGEVERAYRGLAAALIADGHRSPAAAAAAALCDGEEVLTGSRQPLPAGVRRAALHDLAQLLSRLAVDWQGEAQAALGRAVPPLEALAAPDEYGAWARRLSDEGPEALLDALLARYRSCGTGTLSRYRAFRWRSGRLEGVSHPAGDRLDDLIGVERQLEMLTSNVERFLAGLPALHTLLYGPRGSGKSTAVRSLLRGYSERGLRLVEVPPESLKELPELGERLRDGPHRYLAFIDDLSFETGDAAYHPLKTMLEGSVAERPANLLLVATSNRRHLVRESFSERPQPENDDVHAWDTSNERLALADRFGLTITFPSADQRAYLRMVRELARARGVAARDDELDPEAIRFASWGNGFSGRTARQFVDTLVAPGEHAGR